MLKKYYNSPLRDKFNVDLRLLILIIGSVLALSSCRVTMVPAYDGELAKQITTVSKMVDKFYLTMLENEDKSYQKYAEDYINIEVELNSLYNRNKIKALNEHSTRICEITLNLWKKYKEEHKTDNEISGGLIKLNRKTFEDLFFAMQVAEKGKEMANDPPQ